MLSRGEESCGEVGLNRAFSGFFMVGEDISGGGKHTGCKFKFRVRRILATSKLKLFFPTLFFFFFQKSRFVPLFF